MVYKFKVLSDEDVKFYMDIEITSDQTFYDLHELIQDELEWDRSHLATFFIANHNWEKKQEIPLMEMDDKSSTKMVPMDKAVLANYIKDARQKIIYLFDFINDRSFFLELVETKTETINHYYPICTDFGGEVPAQFSKKSVVKNSIFDEDETDSDVFSVKKAAPVIDDDFDEDFGGDSFDKDISFEIDDDSLIADDDEEPDDEPEQIEEDPDDEE